MKKNIARLEKLSGRLEPTAGERKLTRDEVIRYTEEFLNKLTGAKAFHFYSDKGKGLLDSPISEKPMPVKKALQLIKNNVDYPSINSASGGHLGYIPGGGVYYAALGDYIADITNRYAGVFYSGPGAVRMENLLIQWVARLMGFPKNSGGNISSGGSIANMISICTARDAKRITSKNVRKSVIYLSSQSHHSLDKAFRLSGLGECLIRKIPVDDHFRIDVKKLEQQLRKDRDSRLLPFLVIASAGTTDVGAIDPLDKMALLAKKYGCWFHVDAAYGGFFMLTREGKKKLRGIEKSDSLIVDPHKGLFLPFGIGIVLIKNKKQMAATHHYQASYLQDAVSATEESSPADLSPELTKHFRGMRMWLPLKLHGLSPFRSCLEEKLLLAKYFYGAVKALGFETGPEPDLSVVIYRYVPGRGNANAFNKKLMETVLMDGRVFISSTLLDGKFMLRFACLSFRTHFNHVEILLNILKRGVKNH